MTIEVKQMLVKSTVLQGRSPELNNSNRGLPQDWSEIKADILNQCRQMIVEVLREQRER